MLCCKAGQVHFGTASVYVQNMFWTLALHTVQCTVLHSSSIAAYCLPGPMGYARINNSQIKWDQHKLS